MLCLFVCQRVSRIFQKLVNGFKLHLREGWATEIKVFGGALRAFYNISLYCKMAAQQCTSLHEEPLSTIQRKGRPYSFSMEHKRVIVGFQVM